MAHIVPSWPGASETYTPSRAECKRKPDLLDPSSSSSSSAFAATLIAGDAERISANATDGRTDKQPTDRRACACKPGLACPRALGLCCKMATDEAGCDSRRRLRYSYLLAPVYFLAVTHSSAHI